MFPFLIALVAGAAVVASKPFVSQASCNGRQYTFSELAGYGLVPGNARDSFGDTLGGLGSAIFLDQREWKKLENGSYTGLLWAVPDRGWNTEGTLNFQPRVQKFSILFTPQPGASTQNPSPPNLHFSHQDTIRLSGPDGEPCTGLDADGSGHFSYPGFPDIPVATYDGDGFGGPGAGGKRIPVDCEGLVVNDDGSFWISEEYGPYIYHFDKNGRMIDAIRPNEAIIPKRNGTDSFSSDLPPYYAHGTWTHVIPSDNPTGRNNNHGFEGLTITRDGKSLYALLQAATNQEGGLKSQTERYARLVKFDLNGPQGGASYAAEYIVPLPLFNDPTARPSKNPKVAAQSEILHVQDGQFFVLARDSSKGHGQDNSESVYRHVDIFDITGATDIKSSANDCEKCSVASAKGVLNAGIVPATYCPFVDFNINEQLGRFGLHNGGQQDAALLNEKWESLAMVPVDGKHGKDGEYFLFTLSDNDFITQDGFMDGGNFPYKDGSGFDLDTQALVFKVILPKAGREPKEELKIAFWSLILDLRTESRSSTTFTVPRAYSS